MSLPLRIGRWRTLYLALSGRSLDTATAIDWGLVDAVAEPVTDRSGDARKATVHR